MKVTVKLPAELVPDPASASRELLEAVVVSAYAKRRLSQGRVSEILGLSFDEAEALLHSQGVALPYSAVDFVEEQATWNRNPPSNQ